MMMLHQLLYQYQLQVSCGFLVGKQQEDGQEMKNLQMLNHQLSDS